MPDLHKFVDSEAQATRFADAYVVYVEGPTDLWILENMFPGLEGDLTFKLPHHKAREEGSEAVRSRVLAERPKNDRVFGLLDRDTVMHRKDWDTFLEPDDERFRAAVTSEDGIHVLIRWEIENYLFDPEPVLQLLRHLGHLSGPRYPGDIAVLDQVISLCERLLPVSAATCICHDGGETRPANGICSDARDAAQSEEMIRQHLRLSADPDKKHRFDEMLIRIKAFDSPTARDQTERISALLRIVDGKRLVWFFTNKLGIHTEPRWQLTNNLATSPRSPSNDLTEFVTALVDDRAPRRARET